MRYAIGDIQGCYQELCGLLELLRFNPSKDTVWLTGDLVNRGPQSLEVLRLVKSLGNSARVVLGNHDFFLLRVAEGFGKAHPGDTHDEVLAASDRDELLTWLRAQPVAHYEEGFLMVHAGVLPQWSIGDVLALNQEVQAAMLGQEWRGFLRDVFGNDESAWNPKVTGIVRLRMAVNALCRMRYCDVDGRLEFGHKLAPPHPIATMLPWWAHAHRKTNTVRLITGHWSSLGLMLKPKVAMLDSGCLWGNALTALCLDDGRVWQVPADHTRQLRSD